MKRTIIYVFGPKRLGAKYFANEEMTQQEGGWLVCEHIVDLLSDF